MSRTSLEYLSQARLIEASGSGDRWIDMRMDVRALQSDEPILSVGGRWDRREHVYSGPGKQSRVLHLHEGQLEFGVWFSLWLADYLRGERRPETAVWSSLLAGPRRAGKTHVGGIACSAFAVAVPDSYTWAVSPEQEDTGELRDIIEETVPSSWRRWVGEPEWYYQLVNGSRIWMRSSYDPDDLKRGRVDLVLINEGQKQRNKAFVQVRGGIADTGGLVLVTANPPDKPIGQWVADFYEEAKAGVRQAKLFEFDPRRNPFVVHKALEDMKGDVDEETYRREVLGEFLPIGDRVFYAWSRFNVVDSTPPREEKLDVTGEFLRRHFGRPFESFVGADFQMRPMVGARGRAFEWDPSWPDPSTEQREILHADPNLVYTDEFVVEDGTEDDLIDAMESAGMRGADTVVIADASGDWQDAERTKGGRSFDAFRRRGWTHIFVPDPYSKKNPDIVERCKIGNSRMRTADGRRHLFSLSRNFHLNRAIKMWETRAGVPYRRSPYAHLADAVTYPLCRFYPRRATGLPAEFQKIERIPTSRRRDLDGM